MTSDESLRIHSSGNAPNLRTFVKINLVRPVQLLFTEPIVLVATVMSSVAWALIYLFTQAIPITYTGFGFSETSSSLAFIPLAIGLLFGFIPRLLDQRILRSHIAKKQPLSPEDKLSGLVLGAPALAIGFWWLAWTTPPRVNNLHWIVSMLGLVPIGFATNEFACVLSGYLADSYTIYSASAFAALAFVRAICAGTFPLFGAQMYEGLGPNVASSVVAGVATCFCLCPFLFVRYGKRIRKSSSFARYSLEVHAQTSIDDDLLE